MEHALRTLKEMPTCITSTLPQWKGSLEKRLDLDGSTIMISLLQHEYFCFEYFGLVF
jgi:hypothetical protein